MSADPKTPDTAVSVDQQNTSVQSPISLDAERAKRWKEGLIKRGKILRPLLANALQALEKSPALRNSLSYNASSHTIWTERELPWDKGKKHTYPRAWIDPDSGRLAEWLQRQGIEVNDKVADLAAKIVARDREFHPIRDWMNSITWDGTARLDRWLVTYLQALDRDYERLVGPCWIISMVARTMRPGEKADCVLLLIGDQGQGKSTALEILASKAWFTDEIGIVRGGRDTPIAMAGKMLVEFSDLEGLEHKEANDLKAFISRSTDRFRGIFGKYAEDHPRQTIFAGTTNQKSPLKDFTGNRRYWPVATGTVDLEGLKRDREQLWAEAVHRFKQDEVWWLDTPEKRALADAAAEERRAVDELELEIADFLVGKTQITIREILAEIYEKKPSESPRSEATRIGNALQALKWDKFKKSGSPSGREWVYMPKNKPK